MKKYKAVIFDFDGTLVNSLDVLQRVYFSLKESYNLPNINEGDIEKIRGMGFYDLLHFLSVSPFKLPFFYLKIKQKFNEYIADITPVAGITYVLIGLAKNYEMHILTSNDYRLVNKVLSFFNINCFKSVFSDKFYLGKSFALKKFIKKAKLLPSEILYVGDEVRDVLACKKAKIDCCAVSWGLNSKESLKRQNPEYLVDSPEELMMLL